MNTTKSKFDTGKWSEVNGLPGQDDIINYLKFLLESEPNKCYTRRNLMDSVIKEFGIPLANAEAEGPNSNTSGFYTRMTYLITDAIQGKRRAEKQFAKRLTLSVYQHITGNGIVSKDLLKPKHLPKRKVDSARVSVKILKNLNRDPETIMVELGGYMWDDDVLEAAINQEFKL